MARNNLYLKRQVELVGKVFNLLTVIHFDKIVRGQTSWICKCECGNIISVIRNSLVSNNTKSCGCLHKRNLIGKRFGKWLVVKDSGLRKKGDILWECLCDCGNLRNVVSFSLSRGDSTSCGCGRKKIKFCVKCEELRSSTVHWYFTDPMTHKKTSLCVSCYRFLWRNKNKDKVLATKKRFKENNQASIKASKIKNQTNRNLRIVTWTDWDKIAEFENNKPHGLTTDHIIPLQGSKISGLHVSWNLQYLTPKQNRSKHNKCNLMKVSKLYGEILEKEGFK